MASQEKELLAKRHRGIRRVKRWLRPLPRRANIHRYPGLRFFARAARKRSYLWSFRVEQAVPAIYLGCVLTLLPLFGIQFALAVVLALLFRANLPLLAGIQMISNPVTVLPLWYAVYQIGRVFLGVFNIETPFLGRAQVRLLMENIQAGNWGSNFERLAVIFGVTTLGAVILGIFSGFVAANIYRVIASRTAASYALLQRLIRERKETAASSDEPLPEDGGKRKDET